ncbi:enoyl-CoA hydratase [Variovorax sp. LjRoot84]|uniref:enoyl-CoA hydratase n=1 Tax=Variovorax sp. LjRoot84 TaxID=3342340 RepID=UPI003ECDFD97
MYQNLLVEHPVAGVAILRFNRPDKLNALSLALRAELLEAVDMLEADADVRVLVLTGTGRAFSCGLDLDEWGAEGLPAAAGAYEADAVAALARFSGPVIGAVNGFAITGGLEIALACDVLIASSEARFADTHVQVGLLPGWGGSVRLARRVGLHRAKELAFSGRFFDANEAYSWGMVNQVVPAAQLLPTAVTLATLMLSGVPETLKLYKRLLEQEDERSLPDALILEREASVSNNTGVTRAQIEERRLAMRNRKVQS